MIKGVIQGSVCLAALLLVGAGVASAQVQSSQQQKCINKVNKAAGKVAAAQVKANNSCVKDRVLQAIASGEACVDDDPKEKVEGKQDNVLADEAKNCLPADLPDFGYVNGTFAGTTAYETHVDLIHDVFGEPVDPPNLFICDTNPAECLCQRQAISRVSKLSRAMNKIWVKCKNAALKVGKDPFPLGAASAADLAECVTNGGVSLSVQADTKGKLANATTQMSDTISQFCGTTPNDEFGGGECAGLSGMPLIDCLRNQVECRFCLMVNAIDGMAINCSTWSGTTCPP